jgi:hypothetical protein
MRDKPHNATTMRYGVKAATLRWVCVPRHEKQRGSARFKAVPNVFVLTARNA